MADQFDVIVLGMGPGGEVAASRLLTAGRKVAVVERELIGGECAYWACVPSKTLLRPPEARSEADRAPGLDQPDLAWPALRDYRDYMIRHLDDAKQVAGYQRHGATVIKAAGRIVGAGRVEVDGQLLQADHVVVATGSDPAIPPLQGRETIMTWTNREATTLTEIPARAVLLGGSAVGVELGQLLRRLGARVTIVQSADRLVDREDPRVGELIRQALTDEGIEVRVGHRARRAHRAGADTILELDDDTRLATDVVIFGAGRRPRVHGIGLETIGIQPDANGLKVDQHCQVAPGLWALGDVTGVMPFTHVAKYQARVVADNILGRLRPASYRGIPRVIFSDPEIAAAGLHAAQAQQAGIEVATSRVELADAITRPWTYEREPRGELGLVADRQRGVLVGAWAVAPLAGEWIHQAAMAIRAELPITTLLDGVAQYPTYSEAYLTGLEQLKL